MKHVLLILICVIFGMVSCAPIDRCDYKVVIEYRIQNNTTTDTIIIENVPEGCVPYFALGKNSLQLKVERMYPTYNKTLYNGTKTVTVEHFDCTITRQFKVDKWTGEEIH